MMGAPKKFQIGVLKVFCLSLFLACCVLSRVEADLFDRQGVIGVGARAMGMAGAFTAVADDSSAAYWNPAGLVQLDRPELLGMYGSLKNDKSQNIYFSFHYPFENDIHLALSTSNEFFPDIAARQDEYTASVAIPVLFVSEKRLAVGSSFRYLLAELGTAGGTVEGMAVDLGFLFRQPFPDQTEFRAGLALSDISTSIRFDSTGYSQVVPAILTTALAYKFDPSTTFAVDLPWTLSNNGLPSTNGSDLIIKSGLEHWFFDGKFALRAGYISFVTIQGAFSLGASYRNSQWSVDYAFLNHGDSLGNNHRLGASWHFDTGKSQASPKPYIVDSLVGDEKIYLKWDIPSESQAEGYFIYIRSEQEKDFHRAHQEPLKANYCLLRGAKNGIRYHLVIRSIVNGKESFSCNEWVVSPRPISEEAKHYYESGLKYFHQNNLPTALFTIRKAEEIDPNNYDIKDLLHKLETNNHEGLVPEKPGN